MKKVDRNKYSTNKAVVSDLKKIKKHFHKEIEKVLDKYGVEDDQKSYEAQLCKLETENRKLKKEIINLKASLAKMHVQMLKNIGDNDFIQNPTKEFFINGKGCSSKEFAKYLQNANHIVDVTIFYSNKAPKHDTWCVSHFSETSDLNGNLNSGFLRGWRDKGITGIKLELNK